MRLADILDGNVSVDGYEAEGVRQFLAYARVSTDDQDRAGLSIPAQIREMQQYANGRQIVIPEVYREAESACSD